MAQAVPEAIRMDGYLNLDPPRSEQAVLDELREPVSYTHLTLPTSDLV